MAERHLKTIRIRLKTGETFLRKDVEEFLIGRKYFVLMTESKGAEVYLSGDILNTEYYRNGEYIRIQHERKFK